VQNESDKILLDKAFALTAEAFAQMQPKEQVQVLSALTNAAITYGQQDVSTAGLTLKQQYYQHAIALSVPRFESLNAHGQALALKALYNAAITYGRQDSSMAGLVQALQHYQCAIALGAPRFESLNADAQHFLLRALTNAGFTHSQQDKSPAVLAQAQQHYQRAIALGVPRFESLNADAQDQLLRALMNAGVLHCQQDSSPAGLAQEQQHYQRAIDLGEHRFATLSADSQAKVLRALTNAGVLHSQQDKSPAGLARTQQHYERAIDLGELRYDSLNIEARHEVASSAENLETILYNLGSRATARLPQSLVWNLWARGLDNITNGRIRAQIPLRNRSADGPGADRWLTQGNSFPAVMQRRGQASTVRMLAQSRLAVHSQVPSMPAILQPRQEERVLTATGRTIAQARGWPLSIQGAAHWLLALLCAHAPVLLPAMPDCIAAPSDTPAQPDWQPNLAAIASALKFNGMRLDGGGFRAPYYWERLLPVSKRGDLRYIHAAEDAGTIHAWLRTWLDDGDGRALGDALLFAWQEHSSTIEAMATWLAQRGLPDAHKRARDACLLGLADKVVAEALAVPLPMALPHRSRLNYWLSELAAAHSGYDDVEWGLAHTLQRFAQGGLCQPGLSPHVAWELLESARIGLACRAHPTKQRWTRWDDEAVKQIHQAELRALDDAERHIKARQAGRPLPMPDEVDSRIEPFATMAEQWQRMGVGLVFETPATAAALLQPGETLVQLWWAAPPPSAAAPTSIGNALWLRHAHDAKVATPWALQHQHLPHTLDGTALQRMTQPWAAATGANADSSATKANEASNADFDHVQQAWGSMVAEGSAARALLSWLQECNMQMQGTATGGSAGRSGAAQRMVVVLPHHLANLPWQALRELVAPALSLELVASVGAWAQSRRALNAGASKADHATVVIAQEIWDEGGALEAREVAKVMGVAPTVSNDFTEIIAALQSPGPTHLAMHGGFDAQAPQRSALVVDTDTVSVSALATRGGGHLQMRTSLRLRKAPTTGPAGAAQAPPLASTHATPHPQRYAPAQLPAWVLGQLKVQGDVGLGVCDSLQLQVGQGDAQALGAVGMGPVLMAAGARSVVGSLWACDEWAAAVFFALWYDERQRHAASVALGRARQRLRALTSSQLLAWVSVVAPESLLAAQARCRETAAWDGPFAHPWCWAAFALLGNAPALPALRTSYMPDDSAQPKTGSKWRAWWQRIWQRVWQPQR
jgi:CHAT domain